MSTVSKEEANQTGTFYMIVFIGIVVYNAWEYWPLVLGGLVLALVLKVSSDISVKNYKTTKELRT